MNPKKSKTGIDESRLNDSLYVMAVCMSSEMTPPECDSEWEPYDGPDDEDDYPEEAHTNAYENTWEW